MDTYPLVIVLFLFGLIIGSFLNVVIWRLPRGDSLGGRSHCPKCKKTLRAVDLVPLLSFMVLLGRCRYCRAKISFRYPFLEFVTGLLFASSAFFIHIQNFSNALTLLQALIVISMSVAVFVIDLEHYLILNTVVLSSTVILLVVLIVMDIVNPPASWYASTVIRGLLGAGSGVFFLGGIWLVSGGKWMGFGDVKFMVPFGLAVGFPLSLVAIFLSFLLGAAMSIPLMLFGGKALGTRVPFGTFLSVSLIITLFFGDSLLHWYLGMAGLL